MQDNVSSYTFETIHFPQRLVLIRNLKRVSFLINDIVLFVSSVVFFAWITNVAVLKIFLFEKLHITPESSVLFMLMGVSLLFGARRHLNDKNDAKRVKFPWWNTIFPIFFTGISLILGLAGLIKVSDMGLGLRITPIEGMCFFILGLSLIPPFTRIPHRFHVTQLLVFIVSGLSMYVVLENVYQIFSGVMVGQSIFLPFPLALTFAFFCFGILLRWSNRGFFGNFTLDSIGSMFALRIFLINLLAAPLVAFLVLAVAPRGSYTVYETTSLIVIFLTFISSLLIWINVKLLYKYELEHLLMRESLRAHNIDLAADREKLDEKMFQLEQERQQYKAKLTMQSQWQDAVDTSA